MEFKKYSSIENSYRKLFIDKIYQYGYAGDDQEYLVREKVHGCNYSYWKFKDEEIKFAKRTSLIGLDSNFSNHKVAYDRIKDKLDNIFEHVKDKNGGETITIFGELFGGAYSHPDVEKLNFKMIQKGVFYTPDIMFYAYDIKIDGTYVDPVISEEIFEAAGLLHAKTLFKGDLKQCLDYPNDFVTTIPGDLNLPEIENNICEGVVISPAQALYFPNGERIMIKNKNDKFKEIQGEKKTRTPKTVVELPEEVQKYVETIGTYVTENRLRNVLSKVGPVTNKDFGKIAGMFSGDAIEDFVKDYPEFKNVEDSHRKVITKSVGRGVADIIRPNFANIIDGVF